MDPRIASVGAGCGCATVTGLAAFVLSTPLYVLAAWAAYEADLTEMQAEMAVPFSGGCGLVTALFLAVVVGVIAAVAVGGLMAGGEEA